jgi:hypothetical protein
MPAMPDRIRIGVLILESDPQRLENVVTAHVRQVQVKQNDVVIIQLAEIDAFFAQIRWCSTLNPSDLSISSMLCAVASRPRSAEPRQRSDNLQTSIKELKVQLDAAELALEEAQAEYDKAAALEVRDAGHRSNRAG